jgi:Cof subfamily protein (haloacid dehalogenase superfamily)
MKALFFDIDGTLVSFNTHAIPESTIEALSRARANGHKIFIATGRPKTIINNLGAIQEPNLIDGYVTMNGAYCYVGNEIIHKSPILPEEVNAVARFCRDGHYPCVFVHDNSMSVFQPNKMVADIFYEYLHCEEMPEATFEEATSGEVFQITPFITLEQEEALRASIPNCESARWYPAFTDITAKGNTKQQGIDVIINHFGLRLEDTISFGDGGNDVSMLRHAAIGVAMGNANDDVKQHADYITSTVDEDGIKNALLHFGVI